MARRAIGIYSVFRLRDSKGLPLRPETINIPRMGMNRLT